MIPCDACGRTFGGMVGFDRHVDRRKDRCRSDRELRARGMHRRGDGVWVRSRVGNAVMFPVRGTNPEPLTREWFGRPFRALSRAEQSLYFRRLRERRERAERTRPVRRRTRRPAMPVDPAAQCFEPTLEGV